MSEVKISELGAHVSLDEGADMVQYCGEKVTYLFQGEMGIGKSYMLRELGKRLPNHICAYLDVPTMDTADVNGVPYTEEFTHGVRIRKITHFAPNALLGVHQDQPVIIMADELGKGTRPVQNSLLRLLHERKIGDVALPPGSMVFATTNLLSEGLGDYVQEQAQNRVSVVKVRKPSAAEWVKWAMGNGVHPVLISWVKRFPMCLASFSDGEGNPYINYPGITKGPFVTPRSLERASDQLWVRGKISDNAIAAGIAGSVGKAAMTDIISFAETNDRLPSWENIVSSPDTARVPDVQDFAANFISVFSAIMLVERDTFGAWMTYCQRLPKEYQGVFALNVVESPKRGIATSNRKFIDWATENHWMVS
jgi:hypothetical protein